MSIHRAASSYFGRLSPDTTAGTACAAMTDRMLAGGTWTRDGDREEMPSVWGLPVMVYVRTDMRDQNPPEVVGVYEGMP